MQRIQFTIFTLLLFAFSNISAQISPENPPIPVKVEVRNAQGLNFGAFTVGNAGGNVIISPSGDRTGESDVYLLNMGATSHYAIFDVYTNPGTLLQVQSVQNIQLSGPAGSNVTLSIDPYLDISTGQTFITSSNPHEVFVGGRLHIPNQNSGPPGSYSGTFSLTFIHE